MSSFAHDLSWLATSENTLHGIKQMYKGENTDYIILDEPEIGLGEELQLGLADWLNKQSINHGVLYICHSRLLARNLDFDNFINLDGMSYSEWIDRIPVPISLEDFSENVKKLSNVIKERQNE